MIGESEPVEKNIRPVRTANPSLGDRKNMAYMTTSVVKGNGKGMPLFLPLLPPSPFSPHFFFPSPSFFYPLLLGIVVKIGERTQAGKISQSIAGAKHPKTPLQRRLDKLGKILVVVAVVLCLTIFGIGKFPFPSSFFLS